MFELGAQNSATRALIRHLNCAFWRLKLAGEVEKALAWLQAIASLKVKMLDLHLERNKTKISES